MTTKFTVLLVLFFVVFITAGQYIIPTLMVLGALFYVIDTLTIFISNKDRTQFNPDYIGPSPLSRRVNRSTATTKHAHVPMSYGDMFISSKAKLAYLNSQEWRTIKQLRMVIADNKCESCGSPTNLQCHHLTYERLTNEDVADLRILCGSCHQALHDHYGYDRTTTYLPLT